MKISEIIIEGWSKKYKRSIDCSHPKGFSQRAHCQGRKANEDVANDSTEPTITRAGYNNLYRSLASSLGSSAQIKEDMFDFGTIFNVLLSSPSYAQAVIMNALRKAHREWSQSTQMISTMSKMAAEEPVSENEVKSMRTQFGDLVTYGMIAGVATLTATGALASASSGATGLAAGGSIALAGAYKKEILDVIKREGPDIIIGLMRKTGINVINELIHKFLEYNYVLPTQASQDNSKKQGVAEDSMSLHDWFGKGKHGGSGGGGWDRYNTKGERIGKCGERSSDEGKPKCLSKSKAASLRASGGKEAIATAVNKKRRNDSNPDRRGKAINVSSKKAK